MASLKALRVSITILCFILTIIFGNYTYAFGEDKPENTKIMIRCLSCHTLNPENSKYCSECGRALIGRGRRKAGRLPPEDNESWKKRMKESKSNYLIAGVFAVGGLVALIRGYDYWYGSSELVVLGWTGVVLGIGNLWVTIAERKNLKELGKEKGWTLTMNHDNELRLAYNVYLK